MVCPNFALSVLICLRKYLSHLLLKWSKCPNSDSTQQMIAFHTFPGPVE